MADTRLRALVIFVPVCLLLGLSIVSFFKAKTIWRGVQLLGACCLLMVVLTHVSESLQLFPSMQWGLPNSAGHYLDLSSAVLGLTLLPLGFSLGDEGHRGSRQLTATPGGMHRDKGISLAANLT